MSKLIIVEGLIGSGKSTFCREVASRTGYHVMYEPVEENPYLESFYADPKRWALEMQFYLMAHRFKMHQEAIEYIWRTGNGVLMDRSIYGDSVFCALNHINGNIDSTGYSSYMGMRDVMTRFLMVPQITVYLNASPKVCQARIMSRGRDCEREIPLTYLEGLDNLYRDLIVEMESKGSKIINLNWEKFTPWEDVLSELSGHIPRLFERYKTL